MPKTLLLADDSVVIQKLVGLSFANEDVELVTTDNGDDAISRAREVRPDLILADVVMPGKNGYEVCEAIKNDPNLQHIPVLLLTGTFEAFDEERARQVKSDGHITKPFEAQGLVDRVTELLARQPAAPAAADTQEAAPGAAQPAAAAQSPVSDESYEFFDDDVSELAAPLGSDSAADVGADESFAFGSSDLEPLSDFGNVDALDTSFDIDPPANDLTIAVVATPPPATTTTQIAPPTPQYAPQTAQSEPDATRVALPDPPAADLAPSALTPSTPATFETQLTAQSLAPVTATPSASVGASPPVAPAAPPRAPVDLGETVIADDLFAEPVAIATPDPSMPPPVPGVAPEPPITPATPAAPQTPAAPVGPTGAAPEPAVANLDAMLGFKSPEQSPEAMAPAPPRPPETPDPTGDQYDVSISDLGDPFALPPSAPEQGSPPEAIAFQDPPSGPPGMPTGSDRTSSGTPLADQSGVALDPGDGRSADLSPVMRDRIHETLEKVAWEAFADLSDSIVRQVLERVESIVWEVVPGMAEALIQEEIRRMKGDG